MLEVVESIKLVEQAGSTTLQPRRREANDEREKGGSWDDAEKYSHRIEPPRTCRPARLRRDGVPARADGLLRRRPAGEGDVPLRVRARSSCFCNLSVTNEICRGCLIADVPAIVGSIDIVMGEIDR